MMLLAIALLCQDVVAPREDVRLRKPSADVPLSHENLTLYILEDPKARGWAEFITLEEGLRSGKVRVSERRPADVNELLIENASELPCFVQAGDVVKGGQQDRAIAGDVVVPPRSGKVALKAFCVESGRWTGGGGLFGGTTGLVIGTRLRAAIQRDKDQTKVWEAVRDAKMDLVRTNGLGAPTSTSLNEQLLNGKIQRRLAGFQKALGKACEEKEHAVGVVTAVNGKPRTMDLYADPALFRKLYPRLLAAAAIEAMSTPAKDVPAPADVAYLLEKAGQTFSSVYAGAELHRQALFE